MNGQFLALDRKPGPFVHPLALNLNRKACILEQFSVLHGPKTVLTSQSAAAKPVPLFRGILQKVRSRDGAVYRAELILRGESMHRQPIGLEHPKRLAMYAG